MNLLRLTYSISRSYLSKTKSLMILINSNFSSKHTVIYIKGQINRQNLNKVKKFRNLGQMESIIEKFGSLWLKSFEKKLNNDQKSIIITNKVRISEDHATEIEELLWEEFMNCNDNIYSFHLNVIEYFHANQTVNQEACIIFLNRTFENWWKQKLNRKKRNVTKNGDHLIEKCTDSSCFCEIEPNLVQKAFRLALLKMILFSSFNKIYKFEEYLELLKPHIDKYLVNASPLNSIKLVNELKLNDSYPVDYEKVSDFFIKEKF